MAHGPSDSVNIWFSPATHEIIPSSTLRRRIGDHTNEIKGRLKIGSLNPFQNPVYLTCPRKQLEQLKEANNDTSETHTLSGCTLRNGQHVLKAVVDGGIDIWKAVIICDEAFGEATPLALESNWVVHGTEREQAVCKMRRLIAFQSEPAIQHLGPKRY